MKVDKIVTANNILERPFKAVIKRGGASSSKLLDTYFSNMTDDLYNIYAEMNGITEQVEQAITTYDTQAYALGHVVNEMRSLVEDLNYAELYLDMYQPDYVEGASVGGGNIDKIYGQITQYSTEIDILGTDHVESGVTIGFIPGDDMTATYYEESASGVIYDTTSEVWSVGSMDGWIVLTVPRLYEHQESNSVLINPFPLYGLDIYSVKVLIQGSAVDVDLSHCPGWNGTYVESAGPMRLWHDTGIVSKVYIQVKPSHFIQSDFMIGISYIALKEYTFEEGSINIDLMDYIALHNKSAVTTIEIKGWRETELAALDININSPFITIATPSDKPVVITGFKFGF